MTKKSDTKPTKSISKKQPKHPLVQKIDALLKKQGKKFSSAVRDFHGHCVDKKIHDTEEGTKDEKSWLSNFKKYRSRISEKSQDRPYRMLQELLYYLEGNTLIAPQPLLNLVDNDPICQAMENASKAIFQKIQDNENF